MGTASLDADASEYLAAHGYHLGVHRSAVAAALHSQHLQPHDPGRDGRRHHHQPRLRQRQRRPTRDRRRPRSGRAALPHSVECAKTSETTSPTTTSVSLPTGQLTPVDRTGRARYARPLAYVASAGSMGSRAGPACLASPHPHGFAIGLATSGESSLFRAETSPLRASGEMRLRGDEQSAAADTVGLAALLGCLIDRRPRIDALIPADTLAHHPTGPEGRIGIVRKPVELTHAAKASSRCCICCCRPWLNGFLAGSNSGQSPSARWNSGELGSRDGETVIVSVP